jgi:cytoskeleton protein RodZ
VTGVLLQKVAAHEKTAVATSKDSTLSRSDTIVEVAKLKESIATVIESTENTPKLESPATTEAMFARTEKIVDAVKVNDLNSVVAKSAEEMQVVAVATTQTASTVIGVSEGSGPSSAPLLSLDDEPRVFGEAGEESRIKITALVDSWVEVSAGDGELLLTRVLRKGDSYHVPGQTGLTLVTGNAGGMEFFVDGKIVPKIGPLGAVRRNVKLDPKSLMDGTANDP